MQLWITDHFRFYLQCCKNCCKICKTYNCCCVGQLMYWQCKVSCVSWTPADPLDHWQAGQLANTSTSTIATGLQQGRSPGGVTVTVGTGISPISWQYDQILLSHMGYLQCVTTIPMATNTSWQYQTAQLLPIYNL